MKRPILLLPLLALAAGISCGCCLLPIPVYYTHGPGVEGKVLEAGTDRPIPGATVVVRSGAGSDNCPNRTAVTKPDGTFRIPADWDIHFGVWAATPSSGTCLPFALFQDGDGISRWFFNISIEAEGFEDFFGDNYPPFSPSENTSKIPSDGVYRLRPFNPAFAPGTAISEAAVPPAWETSVCDALQGGDDEKSEGWSDFDEYVPSPAEETHAENAENAEDAEPAKP